MGDATLNYTVALILTAIALFAMGGCAYKYYKPNCDPQAIDTFNEFSEEFKKCSNDEKNCEVFSAKEITEGHTILLERVGTTTNVELLCGSTKGKSNGFNTGLCRYSLSDNTVEDIKEFKINKYSDDIRLSKRNNNICFNFLVEEILSPLE